MSQLENMCSWPYIDLHIVPCLCYVSPLPKLGLWVLYSNGWSVYAYIFIKIYLHCGCGDCSAVYIYIHTYTPPHNHNVNIYISWLWGLQCNSRTACIYTSNFCLGSGSSSTDKCYGGKDDPWRLECT
jgi:hypothetical protein